MEKGEEMKKGYWVAYSKETNSPIILVVLVRLCTNTTFSKYTADSIKGYLTFDKHGEKSQLKNGENPPTAIFLFIFVYVFLFYFCI